MKAIFCLALIFCAIWGAKSEIVLSEGIDDPIAWVIYRKEITLEGSSQTVNFPPASHIMDDFRIVKVKISSNKPNGLTATLKDGGRGTRYASVELKGQEGTEFTFSISIVFEGKCSQKTTIDDWNRILASD